jgi:hypothetical protein
MDTKVLQTNRNKKNMLALKQAGDIYIKKRKNSKLLALSMANVQMTPLN